MILCVFLILLLFGGLFSAFRQEYFEETSFSHLPSPETQEHISNKVFLAGLPAYMVRMFINYDNQNLTFFKPLKFGLLLYATIGILLCTKIDDFQSMRVFPWKSFMINQEYGGSWFLTADVNNDGLAEIVSCRHYELNDVHSVSTVACQDLDGGLLWSYGTPNSGSTFISSEQPLLLYDWDDDGIIEVLIVSEGHLISLNGATGELERKLPLPDPNASDCITVCNISGNQRPSDILLKDRYHNIWAFDYQWNCKWHISDPDSGLTCHRPFAVDVNGDGKDEVFVGFQLVNAVGIPLWSFRPPNGVHADSYCIIKRGRSNPADWTFGITYCGGLGLGLWSGDGKEINAIYGEHFESVYAAPFIPGMTGNQIFVEVDHAIPGGMYIMDQTLRKGDSLLIEQNRFERPVSWKNNGVNQIVCASTGKIYNYKFGTENELILDRNAGTGLTVQTGDMNGDRKSDIIIASYTGTEQMPESWNISLFLNSEGPAISTFVGCSYNFSFYNDYDDSLSPLN